MSARGLEFFPLRKGVFFRGSGRRSRRGLFKAQERCHGTDIASSSSSGKSRKGEGRGGSGNLWPFGFWERERVGCEKKG